jgi:Flp pilus assembly protein TadD
VTGDDHEQALLERAERALRAGGEEATSLLVRLAREADAGGDAWVFAHRHLAEIAAHQDPWRAALLARRVVAERPDDAHAWALLGLACSLLGHTRAATAAYERALARTPDNPYYAHNLGHLYDVGLDRIDDAIRWLARAVAKAPGDPEIAASYAHALARGGRMAEARRVLRHAARRGLAPHHEPLRRWIEGEPVTATPRPRRRTRARTSEPA